MPNEPRHACRSVVVEVEGKTPHELEARALRYALEFFGGTVGDLRVALFDAEPRMIQIDGSITLWSAHITVYLRGNTA
jgi:hypothetical protein